MSAQHASGGRHWIAAGDTSLLKCIAAILIVNSHLERLWIKSWMAADGLIGIQIFFAVAGFGLALSARARDRIWFDWYWRRAVRIYPALFVVVVLAQILWLGQWRTFGLEDYLHVLIYPTNYTFVGVIMVLYIIFYPFAQVNRSAVYLAGSLLAAAIYFEKAYLISPAVHAGLPLSLGSLPGSVTTAAALQMMLIGAWLGVRTGEPKPTRLIPLAGVIVIFLAYVLAKYEMVVRARFVAEFWILYPLASLLICCMFGVSQSASVVAYIQRRGPFQSIVRLIGNLSLEIYLVHWIIFENPHLYVHASGGWHVPFPLNLLAVAVVTIAAAYVVSKIAAAIEELLWITVRRGIGFIPADGRVRSFQHDPAVEGRPNL